MRQRDRETVRERERERQRETKRERENETERQVEWTQTLYQYLKTSPLPSSGYRYDSLNVSAVSGSNTHTSVFSSNEPRR